MVGEGIAQQHHQPDNPEMLWLEEEERPIAPLIDQEETVLVRGILADNDGLPPSKWIGQTPAAAGLRQSHQFWMNFPSQQIGALGIGEQHLKLRDLLEFCQRSG